MGQNLPRFDVVRSAPSLILAVFRNSSLTLHLKLERTSITTRVMLASNRMDFDDLTPRGASLPQDRR
ncbi:hypothetical protein NJ76_23125 [Rhodococcus sp. IITR03]|nr:hypothetical protein NJ76_23125 [Rhodococcus sp. IITR03]